MGPSYFCASTTGRVILTHFDGSWHGHEGPRTMQRNRSFETFAHHLPMAQPHLDEWVQPQFWPHDRFQNTAGADKWSWRIESLHQPTRCGLTFPFCQNFLTACWIFVAGLSSVLSSSGTSQPSQVSCLLQELCDPWMQTNLSTRTIHWVFSRCSCRSCMILPRAIALPIFPVKSATSWHSTPCDNMIPASLLSRKHLHFILQPAAPWWQHQMDLKLASWAWRGIQKQAQGLVEELKVGWSFSGDFEWCLAKNRGVWRRTREKEHVNVSLPGGDSGSPGRASWTSETGSATMLWVPQNILPARAGLTHCPCVLWQCISPWRSVGLLCYSSSSCFALLPFLLLLWVPPLVQRIGPSYGFCKTLCPLHISRLWFRDSIPRYPTFDPNGLYRWPHRIWSQCSWCCLIFFEVGIFLMIQKMRRSWNTAVVIATGTASLRKWIITDSCCSWCEFSTPMPYKKDHCHMLSMHTRMPDNMAWTLPVQKKLCLVSHEWTHMKTMGFGTPWWNTLWCLLSSSSALPFALLPRLRGCLFRSQITKTKQHNQTAAETIQAKSIRKNKGKTATQKHLECENYCMIWTACSCIIHLQLMTQFFMRLP